MIQIDDVLIAMDIMKEHFLCDLNACQGICCVEGDAGAPVEPNEVEKLEKVLPIIWNDLSEKARKIISEQGVTYTDEDGDLVTSIVDGKDCVFTCYDKNGCCYCAIEKAFREGKTDFYKPISCHLYPIRTTQFSNGSVGLNYHRWSVCKAAMALGKAKGVHVYEFLKEPLIRKFGEAWYNELLLAADELKKQGYIK